MITVVVEGESDKGVASALVAASGFVEPPRWIVAGGRDRLDRQLVGYLRASAHGPWVVFRDSDGQCPVEVIHRLLGDPSQFPGMCLRLAHSMTEAWLLADATSFADFFQVRSASITDRPDGLPHAKRELLRICSHSKSRRLRGDLVRPDGSIGPLYVPLINEFASNHWDVLVAAGRSPSLNRALGALRVLWRRYPAHRD
ncbi:MAG: hypothetical protein LBV06_08440 [Propionibacteriaceae bacterium]|jgi:hypothetical protein|nr:hypothetical protein [Propionibacteriaceae bacterium]